MKRNQTGSVLIIVLILIGLSALGFAAWRYSIGQNNSGTPSTNSTNNVSNSQFDIPSDWQKYDNNVYTLYYPKDKVRLNSEDFDSDGSAAKNTKELVASSLINTTADNSSDVLFNISVERNAGSSSTSAISDLTLKEVAEKSHSSNVSDTNPNYEVQASSIERVNLGNSTAYTFTTNVGFASDYNVPSNGSGFILPDSTTLRVYFLESSQGDIIRIVIDANDDLAEQIIQTITPRS